MTSLSRCVDYRYVHWVPVFQASFFFQHTTKKKKKSSVGCLCVCKINHNISKSVTSIHMSIMNQLLSLLPDAFVCCLDLIRHSKASVFCLSWNLIELGLQTTVALSNRLCSILFILELDRTRLTDNSGFIKSTMHYHCRRLLPRCVPVLTHATHTGVYKVRRRKLVIAIIMRKSYQRKKHLKMYSIIHVRRER